jgi:capsular polysaccharide biosynthesis protein
MIQKQQNEEIEIDLLALIRLLISKLPIIAAVTILCGALVLGATYFFVTPMYTASTTWYVNNSANREGAQTVSSADLTASAKLVETYKAVITSRTVLNEVIKASGTDISYKKLSQSISTSNVGSTEVFKVMVKSDDPEMAAKLANTIIDVAPDQIADIVNGSSVKIIDRAVVPTTKSEPSYKKALLLGAVLGLFASCAFFVIKELLDTSIKSEADFAQFEYPILSTIPDLAQARKAAASGYGYGYAAGRRRSK